MANSLRAKISKLRHDGNITDAEYCEVIAKLDGHDKEIRNKAIDTFTEKLGEAFSESSSELNVHGTKFDILTLDRVIDILWELAEQCKEE